MGLLYDRIEPVDERDIELVVGLEQYRRDRRRNVARRFFRVLVSVSVALALVHAYVVPLNKLVPTPSCREVAASSEDINTAEYNDSIMFDFEEGEELKCYTAEDTEPVDGHHPNGNIHSWAKYPTAELDSDALFFFAKSEKEDGHHHHHPSKFTAGSILFEASDEVDKVTVQTVVGYDHHIFAKICTFKREDGSLGVGVVVPKHDHDDHDHDHDHDHDTHHPHHPHRGDHRANHIELTVTFPIAKDGPRQFKSLDTRLPLYRHSITDIGAKVEFDTVTLRGTNSPIHAESFTASTLNLQTSNSPINGNYNGTNSLSIRTANAPIGVQISFTTTLKDDEEKPARLELVTANARIEASIDLAAAGDAKAGVYDVFTHTANAPLLLTFNSAPAGSKLLLDGKTVNSAIDVTLDPTYEGTFDAHTVWSKVNFNARDKPEDPAGRERKRTVNVREIGKTGFTGEVFWGDKSDETPEGEVKLATALGSISLTV
ncbi:hypothetical protein BKA62DRAFT_656262 [Auriculariales sp. MPI-PUGE-AT-0066]|nr:hypothetical protein BKA62DRAFT_656262 [Auriculariales sp. MPI-PUGE-AT-0066]